MKSSSILSVDVYFISIIQKKSVRIYKKCFTSKLSLSGGETDPMGLIIKMVFSRSNLKTKGINYYIYNIHIILSGRRTKFILFK